MFQLSSLSRSVVVGCHLGKFVLLFLHVQVEINFIRYILGFERFVLQGK